MLKDSKDCTVAIIGQGYVGLPLSMALIESDWNVIGIDTDEVKIKNFKSGISNIEGITGDLIKDKINLGNYYPTSDFSKAELANTVIICVPTPLNKEGEPDLKFLLDAIQKVSPFLNENSLLISESTSFPGTLRSIVQEEIKKNSKLIHLAVSPERVNPGDKNWNQKNTPRLVSGITKAASDKAVKFYKTICNIVVEVETPEIAEAAKLLENTFRLINISAVNQFTQICRALSLDINSVIDAAKTKPYGFMEFRPSVGAGGHCIPVDPIYLSEWSNKSGKNFSILNDAVRINNEMPNYIAERVSELVVNIVSPSALILGVAYKPGLSDTRESPAEKLIEKLTSLGIKCEWLDPLVDDWLFEKCIDIKQKFSIAVIVTNQKGIPINELLDNEVKILDCTNSYRNTPGIVSL
jgi:UDP-N-acetyl-D-glucosamine dehydrogenase